MKSIRFNTILMILFVPGVCLVIPAQEKKLTYRLSSGRGRDVRLLNAMPTIERWLDDEHYLERKTADAGTSKLFSVNAKDGQSTIFFDPALQNKKLESGFSVDRASSHSEDYTHFLFSKDQDLYYFNSQTGLFKRLTSTPAAEQTPQFSPDYRRVAFTREHNLYVVDVESGQEVQLTSDGSDVILNGYNSWVYYEEIFDRSYRGFWWSPNSDKITFMRYDDTPVPLFTLFRSDSVHGQVETARYPKAGDPNPKVRLGVASVKTRQTVWIDLDENVDQYLAWPFWSSDGTQLYFQWMNRGQDLLKILNADPVTGKFAEVYQEHQPAWVEFFNDVYVLKNGSGFLLKSDKSGWAHLYYYDSQGRLRQQLTSGEWPVKSVTVVDEKSGLVYFTASREKSTETQLYRVGLNGKNLKPLTRAGGTHNVKMSPAGKYFIDTYSSVKHPAIMELWTTNDKMIRELGDANSPALAEYQLGQAELFTIPTSDGLQMPAAWVLPANLDKSKKYPILISIYGGPAAPTVSNSWQGLRSHYYAQNGIIYMSVDHRGSGHFGKKGVALMHRKLGTWEMNDYIDAVKWLRRQPYIDSTRIAITGGSYGGYVTCLALTYGADYFTHGIAEFSVTDYRLYDSIYTERFMDAPSENSAGYDSTAVMKWADRYKGLLRITHGTMDDNVHMQNTIQLIDKLQDEGKHFEMMLYPNGRHGYGAGKSRHAGEEAMRFWFKNLLNQEWSAEQ